MWVADQSELPSGDMGTSGPIKFFDMLLLLKSENQGEMCAQATGRHNAPKSVAVQQHQAGF